MSNPLQRFTTAGLLADRKVTQLMVFAALVFTFFSYLSSDIFFTRENFKSMAYQVPEVAILSIAVMLSMLTGGIDLSIVGISNAAALSAAYIMTKNMTEEGAITNSWILIACAAGIALGLLCGLINSVLIALRLELRMASQFRVFQSNLFESEMELSTEFHRHLWS